MNTKGDKTMIVPIRNLSLLMGAMVYALCALGAGAVEIAIQYPTGWSAIGVPPHAASPNGFAVVGYQYKSDDPFNIFDRSLVIQVGLNGITYETEFDGKVFYIEYSQDGSYLLASQVTDGARTVHLLDAQGSILWSKTDSRAFSFSLSGAAVFARREGVYPWEHSDTVEMFNLAGASQSVVTVDRDDLRGVIVPGDGGQVIFITSRSVLCLNAADPISTAWRLDLPVSYPNVFGVYPVDGSRFALELERAATVIVDVSGTLQHTYDPQALGDADPVREPLEYAAYRMFDGPAADKVTLFNRTGVTYILDLATGQIEPEPIDATSPQGYVVSSKFEERRLFLFAERGVIVRSF